MKKKSFFIFFLFLSLFFVKNPITGEEPSASYLLGKSEFQQQLEEERRGIYRSRAQDEEEYDKEIQPKDSERDRDYLLKGHPLEEKHLQEKLD